MESLGEPDDQHIYNLIPLNADTFQFLLISLRHYSSLLAQDIAAIDADPDLKILMAIEPREASLLKNEARRIERVIEWLAKIPSEQGEDEFSYLISGLSHRSIRLLKSVGLVYLKHIGQKRNQIAQRRNASKHALENLDTLLSKFQEKIKTAGVFGKASPIALLVDDVIAESQNTAAHLPQARKETLSPPADTNRPRPILLESIQLLDQTLRARCLDLFGDFQDRNQHDRFDTVIAEATRILEDRLRAAMGHGSGTGDDLANRAFGGTTPRLRFSDVDAEQKAVLLFFKGVFGHIRNPAHHKLLGALSPERTIQILGMIDYAIHLVETSQKVDGVTGNSLM